MKRTKCTAILIIMLASSAPAIKAQVLKLFIGPDLTSQYCGGVPDCFISDPLYLTGINNQGQLTGYWFTENSIHRVQSVIVNAATSASADLPSPNSMRAGFMWASKINEAGQVVGDEDVFFSTSRRFEVEKRYAGVLGNVNAMKMFKIPGAVITTGRTINDLGDVGGIYLLRNGLVHGYYLHNSQKRVEDIVYP